MFNYNYQSKKVIASVVAAVLQVLRHLMQSRTTFIFQAIKDKLDLNCYIELNRLLLSNICYRNIKIK